MLSFKKYLVEFTRARQGSFGICTSAALKTALNIKGISSPSPKQMHRQITGKSHWHAGASIKDAGEYARKTLGVDVTTKHIDHIKDIKKTVNNGSPAIVHIAVEPFPYGKEFGHAVTVHKITNSHVVYSDSAPHIIAGAIFGAKNKKTRIQKFEDNRYDTPIALIHGKK